jgi:1-acyl-sn-glycerol-3-phosphate acyltransferase
MKFLKYLWLVPYHLWLVVTFVGLMLLILPLCVIASLFGKFKGGDMIGRLILFWGTCWFFLAGMRNRNYFRSKHIFNRSYIYTANHGTWLDAALFYMSIPPRFRPLGKAELRKVPLFGFIYRNACVMVDRSSAAGRAKSVRILKKYLRMKTSIAIFPEGTFNETDQPLKDFYDGAFRLALEHKVPIIPVLYPDATQRMHPTGWLPFRPGVTRSIFLPAIEVKLLNREDLPKLKAYVHKVMEEGLVHYHLHGTMHCYKHVKQWMEDHSFEASW